MVYVKRQDEKVLKWPQWILERLIRFFDVFLFINDIGDDICSSMKLFANDCIIISINQSCLFPIYLTLPGFIKI